MVNYAVFVRQQLCLGAILLGLVACTGRIDGDSNSDGDAPDGGNSAASDGGNSATEIQDSGIDAGHQVPDAGQSCPDCGLCGGGAGEPSEFERLLINLPQDTWYEAPNTHMKAVTPTTWEFGRPEGIVGAWSSGAYDSVQQRMLIWGGGHADYSGNEVYAFHVRSGAWSRLTEPTVRPPEIAQRDFYSRDPLPNGDPVGRHSYDGVEFLPDRNLMWGFGGSMAGSGFAGKGTWVLNAAKKWTRLADGTPALSHASAYDPVGKQVLVHLPEYLHIYDLESDKWTAVRGFGFPPLWPRYAFSGDITGVVDPLRRLFWVVGGHGQRYPGSAPGRSHGNILVWDIAQAKAVTDDWVTTGGGFFSNKSFIRQSDQWFESGGGDIYNTMAPGIDYDSATDSLVAWPNLGAPYALNLTTKEWVKLNAEGSPPYGNNAGGTFGRWRYAAAYNVFILINSISQNVYFYKYSAGCGPSR